MDARARAFLRQAQVEQRWRSAIVVQGKGYRAYFKDEIRAARQYDEWVRTYRAKDARVNLPYDGERRRPFDRALYKLVRAGQKGSKTPSTELALAGKSGAAQTDRQWRQPQVKQEPVARDEKRKRGAPTEGQELLLGTARAAGRGKRARKKPPRLSYADLGAGSKQEELLLGIACYSRQSGR